ncbi:MAG: molecular chaperone TorD family protein [Chlorobi bacterium]|nr:molecular chaperone TorD family protein [Chlorobiota bacterium]
MGFEDFIAIEEARANAFNLFSALFCQPEDEVLRGSGLFASLKKSFGILNIDNKGCVEDLEKSLNSFTETELLVEYAQLFVGPFKTLAPPYSSIYLGGDSVMTDDTIWVLNQYRKMGLDFNMGVRDLPDHVAVEAEYLYYLIFNEIKSLLDKKPGEAKNFHDAQGIFLNEHFNKWVPGFCGHGLKQTDNDYYKALFRCLDFFTRSTGLVEFPKSMG